MDVIQCLVLERHLDLDTAMRLALASKATLRLIGNPGSLFSWYSRSQLPDLLQWHQKIAESRRLIRLAGKMLVCVRKGYRTLSSCGGLDLGSPINLEGLVDDKDSYDLILDIGSACYCEWSRNEFVQESKGELYQHRSGRIHIRTCISKYNLSWFETDGNNYWLTKSDNVKLCRCLHCTTWGREPGSDCSCPKCSDPINGWRYWGTLSYF